MFYLGQPCQPPRQHALLAEIIAESDTSTMPPAKKKEKKKEPGAAELSGLPPEDQIKDCRTPPGEFRQALWARVLICAVASEGGEATAQTAWSMCSKWRCLCDDEDASGNSCVKRVKWHPHTALWKNDSYVDAAIMQHYEQKHFKIFLELQPKLQALYNQSRFLALTMAGGFINLKGNLAKVRAPCILCRAPY